MKKGPLDHDVAWKLFFKKHHRRETKREILLTESTKSLSNTLCHRSSFYATAPLFPETMLQRETRATVSSLFDKRANTFF